MSENELANRVIGLAIEVHNALGPGLLEKTYRDCLFFKINQAGLFVEKEKAVPLIFEEVKLDHGYRVYILVERKLVLELKCVDSFHDIHVAQVLTYLKFGGFKLGLLLNFNVLMLRYGIRRVVLGDVR